MLSGAKHLVRMGQWGRFGPRCFAPLNMTGSPCTTA